MTAGFCKSAGGSSTCARVLGVAELVVVMGSSGPLKVIVGFSNSFGVLAVTVVVNVSSLWVISNR